jgi:transposase-like protein
MGNILHPNAKTTIRVRREIQESKESILKLAKKYSLNPKTIVKWKKRKNLEDNKSGAKTVKSVLSELEQKSICEFRRLTKFSLDDCYIALKDTIPKLSRSNLHRCLKRNGLSRLPKEEVTKKDKKKFKEYDLGFVHIDITTITLSNKKKYYLFVAIDRMSKYTYCEVYDKMTINNSVLFLKNTIKEFPFKIEKILTDNGSQFTYMLLSEHLRPKDKDNPDKNKVHPFDEICIQNYIEHRLTKFRHPWTNGQVEIMNKIIKNHTTKKYFYEDIQEFKKHLMSFILFYNHRKKLKSLKFNSPFSVLLERFDKMPLLFKDNPNYKLVGLNTVDCFMYY